MVAVTFAVTSTAAAQEAAQNRAPGAVTPGQLEAEAKEKTPSESEPPHLPEDMLKKMVEDSVAKGMAPKIGDVHFHGYFRVGYGVSSEGGRQDCFQAPGAFSKFRLGNECDQYGEFLFSGPAYVGDNGVVANANLMLNVFIPISSQGYPERFVPNNGELGKDLHFGANQFYIDFSGLPFLGKAAKAWIGRRFYKREDLHITDYFWWNASGLGGGLEDIPIGDGTMKLSYAMFEMDGPNTDSDLMPLTANLPARTDIGLRNDLRLYGIEAPGGELVLGLNAILDLSRNSVNQTHNGFSATAMYVTKVAGGDSKTAVQYGVGAAVNSNGVNGSLTTPTGTNFQRVVENFQFQISPELGGQLVGVFDREAVKGGMGSQNWISAGGRVSYAIHENAQLMFDAGLDTVKPNGVDRANMFKIAVAPAITAGKGYWARPQLRLFAALAFWNDAARSGVFQGTNQSVGANFGMQAESWW